MSMRAVSRSATVVLLAALAAVLVGAFLAGAVAGQAESNVPSMRHELGATGHMPVGAASPDDTLLADLAASAVRWRGTKFAGHGKHEGVVRLASGTLVVRDCAVISGAFAVDLHTIEVTDIPPEDSVPRRRIRDHLVSADFFDVARYPLATFAVASAERVGTRQFRLLGTLTMHGVTRRVAFPIELASYAGGELRAASRVRLHRQQWGMIYRSFPVVNLLVDDEIALNITLVARRASQARLGGSRICE
ncbi:MAG: YceI family protein [Gemmatimonadaceae bacterium]